MTYDVARVRGLFPSLGDGWIHLDPQLGMQIPDRVATAVSTTFRGTASTHIGRHPYAQRSAKVADDARQAVADLVGGTPEGVVLGPDHGILLTALAEALSTRLGLGTGIVLSRLDDEANVAPWLRIANRYGAQVQWAEVDIETCELPSWQFGELIAANTRLVALTAASTVVGSAPDVRVAADLVHDAGGLLVVDAVGAAPYAVLDIEELRADVVAVNAAAWGGPRVGALVFRDPELLDRLPSQALDTDAKGPARLEVAGLHYSLLAGMTASIDCLAALDENASGTRRQRLEMSIGSLQDYQDRLFAYLQERVAALPHVMAIGQASSRIPCLSISVDGVDSDKVAARLADNRIDVVGGLHGGSRLLESLGVADAGGAITVGLAPYTTRHEIDQLVTVLETLT
ncbi:MULTISPECIES: cysteine desulfurase-like protein [unclassified Rhodococcus (in: high G+C Gram-positive bacteria)]|uniref:cysteine desulfurase-like protein n=1 Tax=unclassified Rhodococcus (in: high G+C Gram-positive bacteria) TaxID=192944 RepID=UPI0006FAF452|nr:MULTISPECIES: cysteine desulfurase-like protein [unclassified Rhodococcus (in: high G+C Gram-positive bacteria)]KQU27973.1 transposase [Rhodococcus sp. Leaf225]KQU46084.1 transposase [Rhodococcus sp. Leaf258]